LLLQLEALFEGDGELELTSRGGDVSAFAQTACHGHMVEFATGILATTDLRLSRIVGYRDVQIGAFIPPRQGSSIHTEGEVLLVLSFSGDVQSGLISGSGGVQRCLQSGRVVTYQLLRPVYHHLRGEWTV